MRVERTTLLVVALLALLPSAGLCQDVSLDISIRLSTSNAHEVVRVSLNNTLPHAIEEFSYELPGDAKSIAVYDEEGNLSTQVLRSSTLLITSRFRSPVKPGETRSLTIEFDSSELVRIEGGGYLFSALFSQPKGSARGFVLKVTLPPGMGLPTPISASPSTDIAPLPDEVISDGTSTTFLWQPPPGKDLAVLIRYVPLAEPVAPASPLLERSQLLLLLGSFVLLLALGAYLLWSRARAAGEPGTGFMREDERAVIDIVRGNEGVAQRRIVDLTGFSKAKVSKIVSELERRGIIRVERVGRRNKLFLTDKFKKM